MYQFAAAEMCQNVLNSSSAEYYRRTRKEMFGKTVDELVPQGENAKAEWKKLEEGFGKIAGWLKEDEFVMGNTVSFGDFLIFGILEWFKLSVGEDSQQWKDVAGWHNGRWNKLVKTLEAY
jgi:glutathione S-transferase